MPLRVVFEPRGDVSLPLFEPDRGGGAMSTDIVIAGAAETDEVGRLPDRRRSSSTWRAPATRSPTRA